MRPQVHYEGLSELRRDLRLAENLDRKDDIKLALKAGADIVVAEAKSRTPSRTGRTRRSIRSGFAWQRGSAQAYVIGGKAAVPWYGWLDFGTRTPVHGAPRSVGPWASSGSGPADGRFIYPAIAAKERQVVEEVERGVQHALHRYEF